MVDAENGGLGEVLMKSGVESNGRVVIPTKGLLDDESSALGHSRMGDSVSNGGEQRGWNGQVENWMRCTPGLLGEFSEGG